jgi:hypothetical protein
MMRNPRREHFAYLRRISAGDDQKISRATAVASARVYRHAWAATDRLLPVPVIEVEPDSTMSCKWTSDRFELEVCFMPDASPFWISDVKDNNLLNEYGDCWDANSSLSSELKENFDRIVGREPARPAPAPPPPPYRPGLPQAIFGNLCFSLIVAMFGGLMLGKFLPSAYWCAAICGGILLAGLILWYVLSEVRTRIADRWDRIKR